MSIGHQSWEFSLFLCPAPSYSRFKTEPPSFQYLSIICSLGYMERQLDCSIKIATLGSQKEHVF